MDVRQLKQTLKVSPPNPVYLVVGEEEALVSRAMELLKTTLKNTNVSDFAISRLEAKYITVDEFDVAVWSQSLFGGSRLVVIEKAQQLKTQVQKRLSGYLEHPVATTTLVLEARAIGLNSRNPKLAGQVKTIKGIKKIIEKAKGVIVECPKPRLRELPNVAQKLLQEQGLRADREALFALVDAVGENLGALIQAIEKIALYLNSQTTVTKQLVEQLVSQTRSQSIFALTDAVGERSADKALLILSDMLRDNENALVILNQIARHWRTLARVQALRLRGENQEAIIKTLGMHPFVVKKCLQQAKRFTLQILASKLVMLGEADTSLKRSRVPERLILEKLVLSLCSNTVEASPTSSAVW